MKTGIPEKKINLPCYLTAMVWALLLVWNQATAQTINIATAADLAKIGNDVGFPLNGNYVQTADIDLSSYPNWTPIDTFTGTYNAQYHYIDNLKIQGTNEARQGLFSQIAAVGEVKNLRMRHVNVNFDGNSTDIGVLAGVNRGKIHRVAVLNGNVRGYWAVGGLVGWQIETGEISEAYANTIVQGNGYIDVFMMPDPMGGGGEVEYQYPNHGIGGLAGLNQNGGSITNSYATGSTSGANDVGGLVGYNTAGSTVSYSYASGSVSGSGWQGGLVGLAGGATSNCYWNITTSGQSNGNGAGAIGKTDAQMRQQATFAGWDFANIWAIGPGSQPHLQWLDFTPLPISLIDFTAKAEGNRAKLTWQTASESNNKEFIIYRSSDDQQFIEIGKVDGKGTTSITSNYSLHDKQPLNGNNYYKLVQVDSDGRTTELGIRFLTFKLQLSSLNSFPNPTEGKITVHFDANKYKVLTITGIDGRVLQTKTLKPNEAIVELDLAGYSKGIYFLKLNGNGISDVQKVMKN